MQCHIQDVVAIGILQFYGQVEVLVAEVVGESTPEVRAAVADDHAVGVINGFVPIDIQVFDISWQYGQAVSVTYNSAASALSASLQVPKRTNPQNEPTGSPIRMILVGLVKLGPPTPKISAGVARDNTLFLFKERLKEVFQEKFSLSKLTEFSVNSKPLFCMEPTFRRI